MRNAGFCVSYYAKTHNAIIQKSVMQKRITGIAVRRAQPGPGCGGNMETKTAQIADAKRDIDNSDGYIMASTWIQCADDQSIGGPFMIPGGRSEIADVNADIDALRGDGSVYVQGCYFTSALTLFSSAAE
jgi:hypothetical protein